MQKQSLWDRPVDTAVDAPTIVEEVPGAELFSLLASSVQGMLGLPCKAIVGDHYEVLNPQSY